MRADCIRLAAFLAAIAIAPLAGARLAGAPPDDPIKIGGAVHHARIWVPEYYGGVVYAYTFDYTVMPWKLTRKAINVKPRHCNPNSVVVTGSNLYVVCNSDFGGKDQMLVYNVSTNAYVRAIAGIGTDGNNYFTNSSLIGSVFDTHGNLWLSGYNTNDLLRLPAAQLTKTAPKIDRQVVHSPDQPAGLTVDPADGSIWVVGQYAQGIVLGFPDATLNAAGTHLGATALNPSPAYCISTAAGPGCQTVAGLFNAPEGVAVFNDSIWVSNNGGNAPTGTIVALTREAGGHLSSKTYGHTVHKPFACPGGMFSTRIAAHTPTLWVNDEGYGIAHTDCGASGADQGDQMGRVLEFLPNDLTTDPAVPIPRNFTYAADLKTASPGFGGIFVQLD